MWVLLVRLASRKLSTQQTCSNRLQCQTETSDFYLHCMHDQGLHCYDKEVPLPVPLSMHANMDMPVYKRRRHNRTLQDDLL